MEFLVVWLVDTLKAEWPVDTLVDFKADMLADTLEVMLKVEWSAGS